MSIFVVDLGGTWLRTAVFQPDEGRLIGGLQVPTPDDPATCRAAIHAAWCDAGRPIRVGIAAAPTIGDDGIVRGWPNRPAYVGHSVLGPDMQKAARVCVVDDGTAAAISADARRLAGQEIILALTVGTGVGGGAVIAGRPLIGVRGAAMEVGHVAVSPAVGRTCACGAIGCVQAIASGRGIAAALAAGCSETEALDQAAEAIKALVAILVRIFDPHRIVLSGGLGLGILRRRLLAPGFAMALELHPYGAAASLAGAGLLARTD